MSIQQTFKTPGISRHDAEQRLIESRALFLGFLRKRLDHPQDAEDVFQDFCVKVLRNYDTVKNGQLLNAWLGITLRHTLTDHYRRRATRNRMTVAYATEVEILKTGTEDPENIPCACVFTAIQRLGPARAALLTRLDLQGEPRDRVAADLGISLNALAVRVHRSRAALKKKIAEICPMCGRGDFMQCDCDHVHKTPPVSHPQWQATSPKL